MSAQGQKQTSCIPRAMSVVRRLADIFSVLLKRKIIHRGIIVGNSPQHEEWMIAGI